MTGATAGLAAGAATGNEMYIPITEIRKIARSRPKPEKFKVKLEIYKKS